MFDKKGVFWFLGLTFGLTWLCDLAIYLRGGLGLPGWMNLVQLSAMMPAFSAIVLGLFFFPESPIFHKRPAGRGRWFYYFFLLYVLLHVIGVLCVWLDPSPGMGEIVSLHHSTAAPGGTAPSRRAALRRRSRGNGPRLAVLGQLALLAALWPGNRRFLRPHRRRSTPSSA